MDIRFFKKSEQSILMRAIDEIWANNHILSRDEALLNYMFYTTPGHALITDEEHYSFYGAWYEGKLIGLLGVMPFVCNVKGKDGLAVCLTNWIVHSEYRDTGAGLALMNEVHSLKPNMILSLGLSDDGAKLYKLMRWNMQKNVPRWIGLVRKKETIEHLLNNNEYPLRYFNELKNVPVSDEYQIKVINELNENSYHQFIASFNKEIIGIKRDVSFIKWRYLNHPTFEYKVITCEFQNTIKGLLVYRIEQLASGEKIGRIVECMTTNQDSAIALANVLTTNEDVLFYDYYNFSTLHTWGLEAIGFKKIYNSPEDPYTLPSRFQPIDLENTRMQGAVYLSDKIEAKHKFDLSNCLYITKSDSDQDRPN